MTSLLLSALTAFAVHAEKSKKKADHPPPPEPPACHQALTGISGFDRFTHAALELGPAETAIVEAMNSDRLFKRRVMARAARLFDQDAAKAQLFLTIRDPRSVRDAVGELAPETREFKDFAGQVRKRLGVAVDRLEKEDLYTYYADEIATMLPARLRGDPKSGVNAFRFATRTLADLGAFELFDDGHSVGRASYKRALHQFANGAYQILYVERGGQPLVKLGLLPMVVDRRPALMIDFLEVDYRFANDPTTGNEARLAVNDAFRFLAERAAAMERELYAITASSSSWVKMRIQRGERYGAHAEFAGQNVVARYGILDETDVDYRVLEPRRKLTFVDEESDPRWHRLVATVFEPALERDASFGARLREAQELESTAKRERLLGTVAKELATHADLMTEVKTIFGIPDQYPVDWRFFVKKLDQFRPSRHELPSVYSRRFVINRKVFRFATKPLRFGQQ